MREARAMRAHRVFIFCVILLSCVGCDQASKRVAESLLAGSPYVSLAGDAVRFQLAFNPGVFLSLGAGLPEALRHLLLIGFVPVALALVCTHFLRSNEASGGEFVALGLVAGGGLGNWLDRVLHEGTVTDFVSLGLGRFRTGIFNLADLAVMLGLGLLLLLLWRGAGTSREHAA